MNAQQTIARRAPGFRPDTGIILGSGLGGIAKAISTIATIPYSELAGFPVPSPGGHEGQLVLGWLGGRRVACMQGRCHLYEGVAARDLAVPVRTLKALGCGELIVTNAAGSLRMTRRPGTIMAISDHINLMGANPLTGGRAIGAYDPRLRAIAAKAAADAGIALSEGVYLAVAGPNFETPAEIRAFRTLGADAVGMSTVPEVLVARQAGMAVLGLSLMTNFAAGMVRRAPSAAEVEETAARAAEDMRHLIAGFLERLAKQPARPVRAPQPRLQRSSQAPSAALKKRSVTIKPKVS
jgi:xanthosine phosphorylase